jgi:GT2 family glycosyltransferase
VRHRLIPVETAGLAIVILAYGDGEEYRDVVDSLWAEGATGARLLVVHNPARPGETAADPPAGVELIQSPGNLGYAGGMNLGLATLRAGGFEHALLLTHDARLRPGCLAALLGAARSHPEFGALGPAQLHPGGDHAFSYGGLTDRNGFSTHLKAPATTSDGIAAVDWIDGGSMLLAAAALARTGPFDERFWSYCEDSDLCLRVRRAGFRVGIVVAAEADQEPGSNKRPGAWAYLTARNGTAYARRAAGPRGLFAYATLAVWTSLRALLRAGLRRVGLRPGPWREPWASAVGGFRGLLDCARGHWGPPPADLPGMGDMRNV